MTEMEKAIAEVWALFKENSIQLKETREQISESIEKLTKNVNRVSNDIDALKDKWGRFIECFLEPGIPRVFQERGIPIIGVTHRSKRKIKGEKMEVDLLGVNTNCVVVVEVKSTLGVDDVRDFLDRLPKFKLFFSEYKEYIVYGAVAGIEIAGEADKFAYKHGLFVIGQKGDTVELLNDEKFRPKEW